MLRTLAKTLLRTLTRVLFRVDVEGTLPPQPERLLIIANHESFLDGLLLGLYLPMNPVFVVHTTVARNRWFRLILSLVDYLAVDPTSPMAMKKVVRLLESGRPVVIFPEGRITTTGSLMKTYDGPAFVAARTGAGRSHDLVADVRHRLVDAHRAQLAQPPRHLGRRQLGVNLGQELDLVLVEMTPDRHEVRHHRRRRRHVVTRSTVLLRLSGAGRLRGLHRGPFR